MRTALICVLIAGLLPYFWTAAAKVIGSRYDNRNVRDWQAKLSGAALRAHYAHLNSFGAFPLFAAAVLAEMITKAHAAPVPVLASVFVVARVLHGIAYVCDLSLLRSLMWLVGITCAVAILAQAILAI